jgi:hypothetical protein
LFSVPANDRLKAQLPARNLHDCVKGRRLEHEAASLAIPSPLRLSSPELE